MINITGAQAEAVYTETMDLLDHLQAESLHAKFPDAAAYADFMDYRIVPDDYMPDMYKVPGPYAIPDDEHANYVAVLADL